MRKFDYQFTSECITEGHPDKVCDQISDRVLDELFKQDPFSRVGCETMAGSGFILVTGEITTNGYVDVPKTVRKVLEDVGYTDPNYGFDYKSVGVLTSINEQSGDIARGVNEDKYKKLGAGDQGMMSGYACDETPELMPLPIRLAQKLCQKLTEVRKNKTLKYLRPDGKSQVTVDYKGGKPVGVSAVVIAAQHDPDVDMEKLRADIKKHVIQPVVGKYLNKETKYYINNTGRFVIGGPVADAGCTGRKIICDSYGGVGNHGGGAFSGKDPTKVDRSAAYMARYIAKNIVAAKLADRCEVQLAYAIGSREPVSIYIDTFGTGKVGEEKLVELVKKNFPTSPSDIIDHLDLRRPIFSKATCYGHFGREEKEFTWEKTDKAKTLAAQAGI